MSKNINFTYECFHHFQFYCDSLWSAHERTSFVHKIPDLNPTEHLWNAKNKPSISVWLVLVSELERFTMAMFLNLVEV